MQVTENVLKWAMRFYPPLFFQRIWVQGFKKDFKGVSVKISKSLLNKNYNRSIFGGTIFAAADPFYPLLFHQIFTRKGYKTIVWLKSARIQYLKPGRTDLFFDIVLNDEAITEAEHILNTIGKYEREFTVEMYSKTGELCVLVVSEVYVRNLGLIKA
jgi:hypothetical protein